MKKFNKGITIITLLVTIVIMLILAGVTINVSIDGGLFGQAQNVQKSSEVIQDIDKISKAIIYAKEKDKRGKLTVENLQKELSESKVFDETGSIIVNLNNTYYEIDEKCKVKLLDGLKEKTLKVICKCTTGETVTKEYKILKNKYSLTPPEIEDCEPLEEILEGEINEDKEIELTYYKLFDDDTELVFTGLNSSGAVTTVESEIVSYMVGDGTTTEGNGLKVKDIQGILKIPDEFKGKTVISIGQKAFASTSASKSNIKKVVTGNGISKINGQAFERSIVEEVVIGINVDSIGTSCFRYGYSLKKVTINTEAELSLGGECFRYCSKFTEININPGNNKYKIEDNVLYSIDGKKIVLFPTGKTEEFLIPDIVGVIGENSFNSCNLTKICISNNSSELILGSKAFERSNLMEVMIGENVSINSSYVFRYCNNLKTVTIDSADITGGLKTQTSGGYLINWATTIYIRNDIKTIGSYITENYTETTSDKEGYIKYVKNS